MVRQSRRVDEALIVPLAPEQPSQHQSKYLASGHYRCILGDKCATSVAPLRPLSDPRFPAAKAFDLVDED
jgi:hypothetical protein